MNTHKVGLCTVLFSFSGYHDFNYMTEYRTQYLSLLRIRPGPGLPMLPGFMIVFRLDNSSLQAEVTIVNRPCWKCLDPLPPDLYDSLEIYKDEDQ